MKRELAVDTIAKKSAADTIEREKARCVACRPAPIEPDVEWHYDGQAALLEAEASR